MTTVRSRLTLLALTSALALPLVSCASPADVDSESTSPTAEDSHGALARAEELAEPPLGLTWIDPHGAVTHLDLLDETVTELGRIGAPTGFSTDGRFVFAQTRDGAAVIDSGVWTWDHADHFHYYRAGPALLGEVEGEGHVSVATTNTSTTGGTGLFFDGSGEAVLLDTHALSNGEITELFRLRREPHAGLVVPVGRFALVTDTTDASHGLGARVAGYTANGEATGAVEECPNPSDTITTRAGAVIGCDDGAILAHVEHGELRIERIPYPEGTSAPAVDSFDNREGRPLVAGMAGSEGIWLLDTRRRAWALLPSPAPLVHVTAVDDEQGRLLALTRDGRVLVLDEQGAVRAETKPLVAESLASGAKPTLIVDQHRAYLSAPVERRLYEIDYADGARIARTFETATDPAFVAETGR